MRFATIALATGIAAALFAANMQGTLSSTVAEAASSAQPDTASGWDLDAIETGSLAFETAASSNAIRLIDLTSGTSCKADTATPTGDTFSDVPFGRDCKNSPSLARISQWRSTETGSLIMADGDGATVLEFAPGDGVLYESVYPADQLITIVPVRG